MVDPAERIVRDGRRRVVTALLEAAEVFRTYGSEHDRRSVELQLRMMGVRPSTSRPAGGAAPVEGWGSLTDAERAVIQLVAEGLTNRGVAERLYLSPHTVSTHLKRIYMKLCVHSRVEATRVALAHLTP